MAAKFELDWPKWNTFVSDITQCTLLSHEEEAKFLSSKEPSLAQYLEKHPEMAHELMVPSGFTQRLLRRYERYLGDSEPLSKQNGSFDKAKLKGKAFDALLPGSPKVISNKSGKMGPSWRELNAFVCTNGKCTLDGQAMAPQFMYDSSGKTVHVIRYKDIEVEITIEQWHLMWDHVVCAFAGPVDLEFVEMGALHEARKEIAQLGPNYQDWKFPSGQQIAIIQKQLEHRLRAAHKTFANPAECCPFRFTNDPKGTKYKAYLTKEEAANLVIEDRINRGEKMDCIYDPIVYQVLKKRGVDVPSNFLKWSTANKLNAAIAKDGRGRTVEEYLRTLLHAGSTDSHCCGQKDCDCSDG